MPLSIRAKPLAQGQLPPIVGGDPLNQDRKEVYEKALRFA